MNFKRCMVCGKTYEEDYCPLCGSYSDTAEIIDDIKRTSFESFLSVVIIGGGVAGVECALRIRQLNKFCSITIISRTGKPYNKLKLLSSKEFLNPETVGFDYDFDRLKINIECDEAVEINRFEKMVKLKSGSYVCYDKLVLATGCDFYVKETPLITIVPYNNKTNFESISRYMVYNDTAVVYGSGLMALNAIDLLISNSKKVVSVCPDEGYSPEVLGKDLSAEITDVISKKTQLYNNTDIEQICLNSVKLTSGDLISAPFIIDASWGKNNISLAKKSGIECDDKIIVSEYMGTSDTSIFALGGAVGTFKIRNILRQAQVIAYQMFGVGKKYTPKKSAYKLSFDKSTYYILGNTNDCDEIISKKNLPLKNEKQFFVKDSILKGVIFKNVTKGFNESAGMLLKPISETHQAFY